MKTIIVATDFSPAATNAARYAAQMAMAVKADLFLINIYEIPMNYGEVPLVYDEEELSLASDQMRELKKELKSLTCNSLIITSEVIMGRFLNKLRSVCDSLQPYAVVLGSQGTTAAQRILFGSHATNSVKNLDWPVITVPPDARYSAVKRIGIACDVEKILEYVPIDELKTLLSDLHAELFIINTGNLNDDDPEFVHMAAELMLRLEPIKIRFRFISGVDVNEGILDFADQNHLDLLMVIPKRHNLFDRLLYSSPSKYFVLHSHVPVVALH